MEMCDQTHAPAALPPGKSPDTHRTGGWVGTRARLDGCEKSFPTEIRFPDRPSCSVTIIIIIIIIIINFIIKI